MNHSRFMRLLIAGAWIMPLIAQPQVPLGLDTTFRTEIHSWGVASVLPLDDGDVLISGQIRFPGELSFRSGARLNEDGSRDVGYPDVAYMGGKITSWNDKVYAASGNIVRRVLLEGGLDTDFISMTFSPYFNTLQGGDYHVFADGRLLIAGRHLLNDTIRGYVGPHCLCWFSNEGYLDTTRVHRPCSGVLSRVTELPNGQFMGSGTTATYDGQPASNIFRFNADGSLDPAFQANVDWGQAFGFLPLADGRVIAAGVFTIAGFSDTLRLARFMPNGSLDPSFNNSLTFSTTDLSGSVGAALISIYRLDANKLIVCGSFEIVEGEERQGICLIDSTGSLIDDYFVGPGCGEYDYQGWITGSLSGIAQAHDGAYLIWGSYHGYGDGATNDTTQRMVSRLHGLDVGVHENARANGRLSVYPNPAANSVAVVLDEVHAGTYLILRDALGRDLLRRELQLARAELQLTNMSNGVYSIEVVCDSWRRTSRLVVQR